MRFGPFKRHMEMVPDRLELTATFDFRRHRRFSGNPVQRAGGISEFSQIRGNQSLPAGGQPLRTHFDNPLSIGLVCSFPALIELFITVLQAGTFIFSKHVVKFYLTVIS